MSVVEAMSCYPTELSSRPDPDFLPRIAGNASCAAFVTESSMKFANATKLVQEIRGSVAECRDLRSAVNLNPVLL